MDSGNKCINGSEISSILWKIGQDPWRSNFTSGFSQGDLATALLSVKLNDCDTFEGKTLEAFVQVPNTANDIVKMFATIDSDNKAIFTLPKELLWYPGDYNINFMYADGDKVNYSNVTNNAYKVISNPALAGQTPPTILPSDKAEYEGLISRLNAETTKAETQTPALKTENDRADILIPEAKSTNDALNLVNEEGKKVISDGNAAQTSWQDTIDNGDAKIGELGRKITEADDKITDIDNRIVQAEQEITDMETRIDDGIAKVDAAVNALPDEIKKITDETAVGIQSLQNQEAISKGNIDTHTTGKIGEIDTEATAKIGEIQTEGTNNKNEVTTEGSKQKSEIITEGTNQKTLVKNQGDSSLAAVVKVEEDVKKILVDNPGSLNALSLSGKTRAEFDNEIESKAYSLGTKANPLVYAFSPKDGAIGDSTEQDRQLSQGYGICNGSDKGLSGVIDKESGSMYIGEGYKNLTNEPIITGDSSSAYEITKLDNEKYKVKKIAQGAYDGIVRTSFSVTNENVEIDTDIIVSCKIVEGIENTTDNGVGFWGTSYSRVSDRENLGYNNEKIFKGIYKTGDTIYCSPVCISKDAPIGTEVVFKNISITNTPNPVPYVPNTAPSGRSVMDGGFKEVDNTIISLDENGDEQEYFIDANGKLNLHFKADGVTRNNFVSTCAIYKKMTDPQKDAEILKIKSGRYSISNKFVGTPHNIPYMPKKMDDQGLTYETLNLDTTRDTWLLEDAGYYEFIPVTGGTSQYGYVKEVNSVWTIPDFFVNVSGVLRLKNAGEIRRVR